MSFPVQGGSDLVMFDFAAGRGYVREFHTAQATIEQQLRQMYANGQRRMGVVVPYMPGGNLFYCDSSNGRMTTQDAANLRALITLMVQMGFYHVMIEMIPQAVPPNIAEAARNFTYTCDVWEQAQGLGIPVTIDLWAEAIPGSAAGPEYLKLLRAGWDGWCTRFGKTGTVGYSINPYTDQAAIIDLIGKVYANGLLPDMWDVHPYTPQAWHDWTAAMRTAGLLGPDAGRGTFIGETACNDPAMAAALKADSADLFWILQWPTGADTVEGTSQDRLTIDYANYANAGL